MKYVGLRVIRIASISFNNSEYKIYSYSGYRDILSIHLRKALVLYSYNPSKGFKFIIEVYEGTI